MHDGSRVKLRKLEADYDPTNKAEALRILLKAEDNREFITGLIYFDPRRESLAEASDLPDEPLAKLAPEKVRPPAEALERIMAGLM
jgi:2-oxoglutarate ferredoxin oxidoreductase subunit beta